MAFTPKPNPLPAAPAGKPHEENLPPTGSTLQNPLPNVPIIDNINPNNGG